PSGWRSSAPPAPGSDRRRPAACAGIPRRPARQEGDPPASLGERVADGGENLAVARESEPALLRDQAIANPDAELPAVSSAKLDVASGLFLQEVRHPGGSGTVVGSDETVADDDILHGPLLGPDDRRAIDSPS